MINRRDLLKTLTPEQIPLDTLKHLSPELANPAHYVPVTPASFHATVHHRQVLLRSNGGWCDVFGYRTDWLHAESHERLAVTISGTEFSTKAFLVSRRFFDRNQEKLVPITIEGNRA